MDDLKDTSLAKAKGSILNTLTGQLGSAALADAVMSDSTIDLTYSNADTHNTKNLSIRWTPPKLDGLRLSGTYYGSQAEFTTDWAGTDVVISDTVIQGAAVAYLQNAGITDQATIQAMLPATMASLGPALQQAANDAEDLIYSKTKTKFRKHFNLNKAQIFKYLNNSLYKSNSTKIKQSNK